MLPGRDGEGWGRTPGSGEPMMWAGADSKKSAISIFRPLLLCGCSDGSGEFPWPPIVQKTFDASDSSHLSSTNAVAYSTRIVR